MSSEEKRIEEEISKGETFFVTSHTNPDPDAVGSVLGLALFLESLGKKVVAYLDEMPYFCDFLPKPKGFTTSDIPPIIFDVAFFLDAEKMDRIPKKAIKIIEKSSIRIVVDHHKRTERFGDINLVDPSAPSTGCLIYRFMKNIKSIDQNIAINIYTTITGDTGSFRYSSANKEAFSVASELIDIGVNPWYVSERLYENHPRERLELLKRALDNLVFTEDGRLGFMALTFKDMESVGKDAYYITDGFVNLIRSIKGIEIAVFARERNIGEFRLSIRGKGSIDVSDFARIFGGGGHRNAAGCVIKGSLEDVKERVLYEGKRFISRWLCNR